MPLTTPEWLQLRPGFSLLLELAGGSPEVFEDYVLRHLNVVELQYLGASCRLLRQFTREEALTANTQAAVASNTQALVQHNIAAGAMRVSQQPTAAAIVFSPCGQLVAWPETAKDRVTLEVEERCTQQRVFSQALPRPVKRRGARPCTVNTRKLSWSHDSRFLTLTCARGIFAADLVSGAMRRLTQGLNFESCTWAPSAANLAVFQSGSQPVLSLYQGSGNMLHMARQTTGCRIWRLVWAANSLALALSNGDGIFVFPIGGQDQLGLPISGSAGSSALAWSPPSWAEPCLLCLAGGEALFVDCEAALKGRGEDPVQSNYPHPDCMVWGEHGVILRAEHALLLFDVCGKSSGLGLETRLDIRTSSYLYPVLSPDQVHVCLLQATERGSASPYELVILNIISECQTFISLSAPGSSPPVCSWTSNGFCLAVTMGTSGGRNHLYKVFSFVFNS